MLVYDAKAVARRWVVDEATSFPNFAGAFFHGATNWLPDDASLPATSDLDVMVVLADPNPPTKPGKFIHQGVLLEVSFLPLDALRSAEAVLSQYHLAGSFRSASVIADPSAHLTALQAAVAQDYAKLRWVRRRGEHAREKVLTGYTLRETDPFPDQVTSWVFPAGILTHVLLVAGLKNPTVRRRYEAVHDLLAEYDRLDLFAPLLDALGCAGMSKARVEHHLAAMTEAFDAAASVIETPFPFASDISQIARPIAIDGSREMIARGHHRAAVFWMVVTYSRCQQVFLADGTPELRDRFDRGYRRLLGDLGIASFADLARRREQVMAFLPRVWEVAEEIMANNRGIED